MSVTLGTATRLLSATSGGCPAAGATMRRFIVVRSTPASASATPFCILPFCILPFCILPFCILPFCILPLGLTSASVVSPGTPTTTPPQPARSGISHVTPESFIMGGGR